MSPMGVTAFTLAAVLIMAHEVTSKRGCSAFGHSCYGGHGKRSGDSVNEPSSAEILARRQGQEEYPPHPEYPHYSVLQLPGDDIIPIRDGGVYDHDENAAREAMKYRLRNLVKHWMDSYRHQSNEDGYYLGNM